MLKLEGPSLSGFHISKLIFILHFPVERSFSMIQKQKHYWVVELKFWVVLYSFARYLHRPSSGGVVFLVPWLWLVNKALRIGHSIFHQPWSLESLEFPDLVLKGPGSSWVAGQREVTRGLFACGRCLRIISVVGMPPCFSFQWVLGLLSFLAATSPFSPGFLLPLGHWKKEPSCTSFLLPSNSK